MSCLGPAHLLGSIQERGKNCMCVSMCIWTYTHAHTVRKKINAFPPQNYSINSWDSNTFNSHLRKDEGHDKWALPTRQFFLETYSAGCFACWNTQPHLLWGGPAEVLEEQASAAFCDWHACLPSSPPSNSPVMSSRLCSISIFIWPTASCTDSKREKRVWSAFYPLQLACWHDW